jgi:hypothetical protein
MRYTCAHVNNLKRSQKRWVWNFPLETDLFHREMSHLALALDPTSLTRGRPSEKLDSALILVTAFSWLEAGNADLVTFDSDLSVAECRALLATVGALAEVVAAASNSTFETPGPCLYN